MEARPDLRDADAFPFNIPQRFEARARWLRRREISHERKARHIAALAGDDRDRALSGEIKQAARERGDADIDIARGGRHGDRLRRVEKLQLDIDSGVAKVTAIGGDKKVAG